MSSPVEQTEADRLAIQLMECAILVKKGERTAPLVLDTLDNLRSFIEHSSSSHNGDAKRRGSNASPTNSSSSKQQQAVAPSAAALTKPPTAFGVLGKMMGMSGDIEKESNKTSTEKTLTSRKNADRVKADLQAEVVGDNSTSSSWLPSFGGSHAEELPKQSTHSTTNAGSGTTKKSRPEFQRPASAKTALISNGWIEQQRRSRMRTVWKDVLASLVEGRKPGEETTLWIQRQITNASGVAELEALHQIPVKWLQDVTFLDYSVDNRFSVRVYNLNEEFVFRCPKDPEAAQNWVMTLRSAKEDALRKGGRAAPPPQNGVKAPPHRVETHHQDEKKSGDTPRSQQAETPLAAPTDNGSKTSIKEMRALAHGVGVNTHGMERGDLERIVARLRAPRVEQPQAHKSPDADPKEAERRLAAEVERRLAAQAEKDRRRRLAEAREVNEAEEEARRHRDQEDVASKEVERKRQEDEHQRLMAERVRVKQEALRKQHGEEERQRLARERQLREEEEMNRRLAEQKAAEQRRLQEEAVRRQQEEYRRRQETWQQQQTQEEQRRRMAEQQEAEQRRQQEEAYRRQWQQQQQQQHPGAPPPQWQHHNQGPPPPQQQPGYAPQGHPQQQPQQNQGFYGQQQQQQQQGQSPPQNAGNKYAEMAAQKDDNTSSQRIKHQILMFWALQPPLRQGLRRIEELITTIHQVFPPAFGVPGHEYFAKWKAVLPAEVDDDDKLEKRVKKLRFFLHPDKLPRDLTTDQSFVSRMLWDVTSDALEEHEKKREDLGWIHN